MSEASYYEPIKVCLNEKFLNRYGNCYLEITAQGFSEKIKSAIQPNAAIIFSFLKTSRPDITGYVEIKQPIETNTMDYLDENYLDDVPVIYKGFIIVEIKRGKINLRDIYQAKRYADLFGAEYSFLLSQKPIPEEIKRIAKVRRILSTSILSTPAALLNELEASYFGMGTFDLILAQFSVDDNTEPMTCSIRDDAWFSGNPFHL